MKMGQARARGQSPSNKMSQSRALVYTFDLVSREERMAAFSSFIFHDWKILFPFVVSSVYGVDSC